MVEIKKMKSRADILRQMEYYKRMAISFKADYIRAKTETEKNTLYACYSQANGKAEILMWCLEK